MTLYVQKNAVKLPRVLVNQGRTGFKPTTAMTPEENSGKICQSALGSALITEARGLDPRSPSGGAGTSICIREFSIQGATIHTPYSRALITRKSIYTYMYAKIYIYIYIYIHMYIHVCVYIDCLHFIFSLDTLVLDKETCLCIHISKTDRWVNTCTDIYMYAA